MKKKFQQRPKRDCAFCGDVATPRGEHLYSRWMHKLLNENARNRTSTRWGFIPVNERVVLAEEPHKIHKSGAVTSIQVPYFCKRCNNEWMNKIEEAARPTLTRMIQGEQMMIEASEIDALTRWAFLKAIVLDLDYFRTAGISSTVRSNFYKTREVPPTARIWLSKTDGPRWRTNYRHGTVAAYLKVVQMAFGQQHILPNTIFSTMSFGGVFLHTRFSGLSSFDLSIRNEEGAKAMRQIHPPSSELLDWPPSNTLNDEIVELVSSEWRTYFAS